MSKFEMQWDRNTICPYCSHEDKDSWEHDLRDEESLVIECDCGKKFTTTAVITREFRSVADCVLNGEEHVWEEYGSVLDECSVCGEVRRRDTGTVSGHCLKRTEEEG